MKIIDYFKEIVALIKQVKKEFILGFFLGLIVGLFIIFWSIFTIFSLVINGPETLPILDYLTIALTLFGFTLVGGIFEKENDELEPIAKSLFKDSLIFLSSGASFLLAYSLISFVKTDFKIVFEFAYAFGVVTFAIAIGRLLIDLYLFYMGIKKPENIQTKNL